MALATTTTAFSRNRLWIFLLVGFLVLQLYLLSPSRNKIRLVENSTHHSTLSSSSAYLSAAVEKQSSVKLPRSNKGKKLADGCLHVLLDVGANIGVNARFLYEPELYPKTSSFIQDVIFNPYFGTPQHRDNRDFCVFAWEPNPAHKPRWYNLTTAYNKMGWKLTYFYAGVSDQPGEIIFYHINDLKNRESGFTAIPPTKSILSSRNYETEHVPVIRLSDWLWNEVYDRNYPKNVYGNYNSTTLGKVVMKIDIETMEYIVVPDLLLSGALCNTVDLVYGEFHFFRNRFPLNFPDNNLYLKNSREGRAFFEQLQRIHTTNRHCRTKFIWKDYEGYLHDGLPLP